MQQNGEQIINSENENTIIEDVIKYKSYLERIIVECFENSKLLKNAMDYGFEHFMNLKTNAIAELTSKYIDSKLRKQKVN